MDPVKTDLERIQMEWDLCVRELEAAREQVDTQARVSSISAELTELDRDLEDQDRWMDTVLAVEKCDEAELRKQSGECQVRAEWVHIQIVRCGTAQMT